MPVRLHYGDILDVTADVIVNAANTELQHGGGVAAAIARAGGPTIQEESDRLGWCDLGSAVMTGAGDLSAKFIVHVPTIDYRHKRRASIDDVGQGSLAALTLAKEAGAGSIVFPLLGTGFAGLKTKDVGHAILEAARRFEDMDVTLCVFWQGDLGALRELGVSLEES